MINIDWISFVIASIAVVLSPGPGSLFVARTAGTSGLKAAQRAMLGIMVGDTCLIILSVLGVSALFRAHPSLFHALRLAGAGYLLFLGLRLVLGKSRTESFRMQDCDHSFRQAISITLLNPKAVFFFMAFFPLFIGSSQNDSFFTYASMTLTFQFISAAYLSLLIRASSWTASALRNSGAARFVLEKLCGCIFIGFGLKVAITRR